MTIDQRDRINSTSGTSLAALDRPRLRGATLCRQLREDTGPALGTDSRPCLTVLAVGAQSDVELMRCFRAGDWGGLEALYDRYFTTVYSICRRTLTCPETALDSANDTFLALIADSGHLDPYRLDDWLRGMAHDLAERRADPAPQPRNGSGPHLVACYAWYGGNDRRVGEQP